MAWRLIKISAYPNPAHSRTVDQLGRNRTQLTSFGFSLKCRSPKKKTNHFQNKNDSAWRALSSYRHPNDMCEKRGTIHLITSNYHKCEKSIGQTFRSITLYPGAWKAEDEKKNRFLDLKLSVKFESCPWSKHAKFCRNPSFSKIKKTEWEQLMNFSSLYEKDLGTGVRDLFFMRKIVCNDPKPKPLQPPAFLANVGTQSSNANDEHINRIWTGLMPSKLIHLKIN